MSAILEDLFEQIINSEQKAEQRKSLLNEVKSEISKCVEVISELMDDGVSLKGQLAIKSQQLNDSKVQINCLTSRSQIYKDTIDKLTTEHETKLKHLEELRTYRDDMVDKFSLAVEEFSENYDLLSGRTHQRDLHGREELNSFNQQIEKIQSELDTYQKHDKNLQDRRQEKENLMQRLKEKEAESKDQDFKIQREEKKVKDRENEKAKVSRVPLTSPEFVRLQRELEICRDNSLEGLCAALQKELQEMQRQQWQSEMEQRQQQTHQRGYVGNPKASAPAPSTSASNTNTEDTTKTTAAPSKSAQTNFKRFTTYSHPLDPHVNITDSSSGASGPHNTEGNMRGKKRKPNISRISQKVMKQTDNTG